MLSMFLCPSTVFTCMMSFVLWYSVVPFQCRKVWKWICLSLGLLSLVAVFLRSSSKLVLSPCVWLWNTVLSVFGRLLSMAVNLVLIGRIRALLPFSAVM